VLDATNSLRCITNFFSRPNESLRSLAFFPYGYCLLCSIREPCLQAPGQAWTAQQKLYAIELKRKSPDKKLDDTIVAIKAKYDRDVSASTLHAWLKPVNTAKIEQLVNASGHNDGGFKKLA
jgi:hypothetical protein